MRYWFLLTLLVPVFASTARAHDADSYGGLYRSRDAGATWLPADAGLFINASNAIAIHPADSNHLLYGTDTRLLRSQNGGRDWHEQAPQQIAAPILSVAFDVDGNSAFAATTDGLFRSESNGQWRAVNVPFSAFPIAQIVAMRGKIYLAGNDGIYMGSANSQDWRGLTKGLPEEPVSALLVDDTTPGANIHAVVAGRIWRSEDDGKSWQQAAGNWRDRRIDIISADLRDTKKIWAGGASQLFRSDDRGKSWQVFGKPLPDPNIFIRGIAISQNEQTIVLTTHRGLFRSADGGASWAKIEGALPLHLEPSPLAQDRHDPNTTYAGFSLRPYNEAWRAAQNLAEQRRNGEARGQITTIVGGAIAIALVIGAGLFLRRRASRRELQLKEKM